ncbi:M1 family metallopeptidase [Sphingosinicellaceae bacterium]|nr:M1 family metallopeptidase [Sphingosinicellaceae bacterium]
MSLKFVAGALASLLATSALAATTQLPRGVTPLHYDVALTPDAKAAKFGGVVGIDLQIDRPTSTITLNAAGLKFASARLSGPAGTAPLNGRIAVDEAAQTATFTFARMVTPGRYRLTLDYAGTIGTQATGLFLLDYPTAAGSKRALYTQFENSSARMMIPSWDEPSYKATFTLSADVPKGQMPVSNMPIASRVESGDHARVTFAPSPKMSTYLLFFGLGAFDRITAKAGQTEVGVIAKAGGAGQGQFALDSSVLILNEYNDYFGVAFPLPKLDNVAAPGRSQFFGAMENWGAIFTFEYAILLDPTISTQADKQRSFEVSAHEMAHQWFGDLVTMAWWDDLWLNEGFASWMEGRTSAKLHPEWHTALSAVAVHETAMAQDGLPTTHPVIQKIATVEQASQAFDSITYSKGESVIRMLEAYVGADAWRDGVRRYMKAHAYGNTVSDDLWREMDKGGKPVTAIAHQFTLQPGVPLISVATSCNAGKTVVSLKQGEFTKDKRKTQPRAWQVPVIVANRSGTATTLVSGGQGNVSLAGCEPVVVNAGQTGYFRTLYSPADFARLSAGFTSLAPIDQLGIIADSWALGLAGKQPASDALALLKRLPVDADPQIWGRARAIVESLDTDYSGDPARQAKLRAFGRRLLSPVLQRIGWSARGDEVPTIAILRAQLIATLGTLGDPDVVSEARRRFAAGGAAMPAEIRKAVLGVVAENADPATWERLRADAAAEKTPLVRDQYYELLGTTADRALAQRALELALTTEPGATNSAGILNAVAERYPALAFDFAVAHIAAVDKLVDETARSRFYARLADGASDGAVIDRLNAYAAAKVAAGSRRPVDEAIASIRYNAMVRRERLPVIDAWLAKNP